MLNWNISVLLISASALLMFSSIGTQSSPQESKSSGARMSQLGPDSLLEVGQASNLKAPAQTVTELKIVSYNIRWRGGEDLRKLIRLFRDDPHIGGAAILGLQEVDRNKNRTAKANTVKLMADELGMHYAWAAPPTPKPAEEETGVAILSPYSLSEIQRIVLPFEGPGNRRRVALGATVKVGSFVVRFYSIHAETRITVERKIEQLKAVLQDLERYPKNMPAIVLGDFNTWELSAVSKTHKLFADENFATPFDDQPTFSRRVLFFPVELKLDWIWLRNLDVLSLGIERTISLSDHWPLWSVVKLQRNN